MNRINKLTILLLSITGSVVLTGCSSSGKTSATKLAEAGGISKSNITVPKAMTWYDRRSDFWYDKYYPYKEVVTYPKLNYDHQHIYGMGTSILEIANNKTTKLVLEESKAQGFIRPKIIDVACYPEHSAKLAVDENGSLHILPQKGHVKTNLFVVAENGLKQNFLIYFVNKKAMPIVCTHYKNLSLTQRLSWFWNLVVRLDYKNIEEVQEAKGHQKDLIAFLESYQQEKKQNPNVSYGELKNLQMMLRFAKKFDLTVVCKKLAKKSSKNKFRSKNKSKQFSVSGQANHQAQSEALRQDLTNAQYIMFARPTPENFKKYRVVLDKVFALGEQLGDAWETTNFPELKNIREYIEERYKVQL